MIGARQLLKEARLRPSGRDAPADVNEALRMLSGKLPLRGRRWRWPRQALVEGIRVSLEEAEASGLLAECVGLLRAPTRAYELGAPTGGRRFTLLGAYEDPASPRVLAATVSVSPDGLVSAEWEQLAAQADELAGELEELFLAIPRKHRPPNDIARKADDRILLIGGSAQETKDATWRDRIDGIAQARGFAVTILENVAPRIEATQQHARRDFRGRAQYVLARYCGSDDNAERLHQHGFGPSFLITETDIDEQLIMLRLHLDELAIDLPEPPAAQPRFDVEPGVDYYFKKIAAGGGGKGDVMIHKRDSCSHSSWSSANKADQALMGIASLVGRRPSTLSKCLSCTGGGFWRARFD